jgi:predicted amidophosphoribosyltransferase
MICPSCKAENSAESNYCKSCGKALVEKLDSYQRALQSATVLENEGQFT